MNTQIRAGMITAAAMVAFLMPYTAAKAVIHVVRPVANAIVRESVPVRVARRDLPPDAYVAISIDGQFRTANMIPPGEEPVFVWNTKAPYTTPDDPDTKKYVTDGLHTITLSVHSGSGKILGVAVVPVRVANLINPPSTHGVKLAYQWRMNEELNYQRKTGFSQSGQSIQGSAIKFARSVEDEDGDVYLIRDKVLGGFVYNGGQPQLVASAYQVKSKYRSVDPQGRVLDTMAPLSAGNHFGFGIPVLPSRRVSIGDSWQTPIELSLEWSHSRPATVIGEGRLEGYEWQDGYPTARIRETYSGPARFPGSGGSAGFRIDTVHFTRIIYFAYNSGRIVRSAVTMDVTSDIPGASLLSGVGGAPAAGGFAGGGPPPGFGGGGPPPGFGGGGPPPGFGGGSFRPGAGVAATGLRTTFDVSESMQLLQ